MQGPSPQGGGFFCAMWHLRMPQKAVLHVRHGATKLQTSRMRHGNKHHRLTESGRNHIVLRPKRMCASDGVHVCFGRDTCVLRPVRMRVSAEADGRYGCFDKGIWPEHRERAALC